MPNNFASTIPDKREARKAVMMFKDDYLLNFINIEEIGERDKIDVDERVIENEMVANIKKFFMTFGTDFTFVGNQAAEDGVKFKETTEDKSNGMSSSFQATSV